MGFRKFGDYLSLNALATLGKTDNFLKLNNFPTSYALIVLLIASFAKAFIVFSFLFSSF